MKNTLGCLVGLAFILTGITGCSSTPETKSAGMTSLLLAEPEPVNARSQMAIARYNHILNQAPLKADERAELLFQRGMLYDSVGLSGLARYDYSKALELKPDMAEAYNSIGIHHIQQMDFNQAYEAFDSTLDLNPSYDFAILNRGIALYYGGRLELAADDLQRFYEIDPQDPYRVLWSYLVKYQISPEQANAQLMQAYASLEEDNWARILVDYYLQNATEADVISTLLSDVTSQKQLNDRLCEAYFYLGKHAGLNGNTNRAANYFKLALSTNVFEYVEHRYARLELSRLRQSRMTSQ